MAACKSPSMDVSVTREPPFQLIPATRSVPLLYLCDHATNIVPASVNGGSLGLPESEMGRHIAYDIGARGLTLELARLTGAAALMTRFSRLVIDPNRGEDDPTLLMKLYDGTVIPGNRNAGPEELVRRKVAFYDPYHCAIEEQLAAMEAVGPCPSIVSIHSFTPQLRDRPPRPWHVGILWDRDGRIARPLITRLRTEPDLVVGDNEPYTGELTGDTMYRHGTRPGRPHVLIEVRQDLIATGQQQAHWAERLAPHLTALIFDEGSREAAHG